MKNKKKIEEPLNQILKIGNIISITVLNLIQIQNSDLSENFYINFLSLKGFRFLYYQNLKRKKNVNNFFFHWLKIKKNRKSFNRNFKI